MKNLLRVGKTAQRQRGDGFLPAHNQADGGLNIRVGDGDYPEMTVQIFQPVIQRHHGAAHAALNRLNDLERGVAFKNGRRFDTGRVKAGLHMRPVVHPFGQEPQRKIHQIVPGQTLLA